RSPACAELVNGVCQKIDTSLLQGGAKDIGKMSTNSGEFIVKIFIIILSFAGGIALLLIILSGYKIIMSKGKPEAIQQGKEQLISAIIGLVFIIFSFVIFQLVFVDILKIPGIIP
ncbi:pilin, partial [Patescibacteria group bacterium]|nr:pilin [Patescibacteria group bacterium]